MAIRSNQGYRKDLNLVENPADADVWNNLYDAGIDADIKVLRNNLRNTSIVGFSSIFEGFFEFGIANDFVYTNDDKVGFSHTVTFGSTNITYGTDYYVTESNGRFRYKISENLSTESGTPITISSSPTSIDHPSYGSYSGTLDRRVLNFTHGGSYDSNRTDGTYTSIVPITSSSVTGSGAIFTVVQSGTSVTVTMTAPGSGYNVDDDLILQSSDIGGGVNIAVTVAQVGGFDIIRKDPVHQGDMVNFIKPERQDDSFDYAEGSINSSFDSTQSNNENAEFTITQKYKGTDSTTSNKDIKTEGSVLIHDPKPYNTTPEAVANNLNGVFIGDTRAFSTDNNPWTEETSSVKTQSEEVTIGELNFQGTGASGQETIDIDGITVTNLTGTPPGASNFTHKMPILINGETYYILLKS
tara:strand:- start:842 stop:2077 length:1236 start_codon:yes stop_codon:yes gene_type:complete